MGGLETLRCFRGDPVCRLVLRNRSPHKWRDFLTTVDGHAELCLLSCLHAVYSIGHVTWNHVEVTLGLDLDHCLMTLLEINPSRHNSDQWQARSVSVMIMRVTFDLQPRFELI
ncbi:hypothetical protein RRG08_066719 [Elysia crispata]|uniref:Uncharacterized protein n=1 Tax=Elysia crispata TaxID=231223 RepID=A0AAE1B8R6_9GAST|nr:hypothetical protein RRG08_066719 [Elysia crispata]